MLEYQITYSQQSPSWADILLGNSQELTIGNYGCLLTCMAMASTAFGYEENPATLNSRLVEIGGFSSERGSEALVIPAALPQLHPAIQVKDVRFYENDAAPLSELIDWVAAGESVIIQIDNSPAQGLQSHWLVLCDTTECYRVIDSWDGQVVDLSERYGNVSSSVSVLITAHLVYHHTAATSSVQSVIGRRRIIADRLNVRCGPGTEYDAQYYLSQGDEVDIAATQGNWAQLSDGNWMCERQFYTESI